MKTKYIMALGALASSLAIVPLCTAVTQSTGLPQMYPQPEAPAMPPVAVWDGTEYVGQVDGRYYYLGPNNTWLSMDKTRQQRFDEWQETHPGNANGQPGQGANTRSMGAAKGENAIAQTQASNPGYQNPEMAQAPGWENPNWQSSQIRNTRYQGHDMGQTHPVAPPLEPQPQPQPQ